MQCVGECCQSGTQQRQVECVAISDEGGDQEVLFPESHCLNSTRPASEAACELPGCPQWGVSVWSDCSSSCGEGVHTRNVQCLLGGHELPPSACCGNRPPHNLVCTSNPPCPTTPHPQGIKPHTHPAVRIYYVCNFHYGVKGPQRMSSISTKAPYYSPWFLARI